MRVEQGRSPALGGIRYAIQRLGLLALFGVILFAAAGRWDWARGWVYLLAVLLLECGTLALLAARVPEMLRQRGTLHADVKRFDRVFAVLWLVLALVTPAVAGLDAVRFRWSHLSGVWGVVGLALLLPASALAAWAMLENPHFEQLVRIQQDREHRVVTTGPYRLVRHPGYLAAMVGALASPLVLGSAWTFAPAGLVAALFAWRTRLEDRTLLRELPGYEAYAARTRFRLVPGLW